MNFIELLFLAAGLSADAFAASVCKGLTSGGSSSKKAVLSGLWFGGFQALMPMVGWLMGSKLSKFITGFDHWIIFALLVFIGGSMAYEAFSPKGKENKLVAACDMSAKAMLPLSLATSLDALAVGVTFSLLDTPVVPSSLFIGCVTFIFSFAGVKIGGVFGAKYEKSAKITGGIILIFLGVKILLEHLGIVAF